MKVMTKKRNNGIIDLKKKILNRDSLKISKI